MLFLLAQHTRRRASVFKLISHPFHKFDTNLFYGVYVMKYNIYIMKIYLFYSNYQFYF